VGAYNTAPRRRRFLSIATASALMAIGFVWAAQPSLAVHDNGMFELDGNTVHNSVPTPPYDWNSLFDASGNRLVTPDPDNGPVLASTFVKDTALPDQSYFTSNKDIQPIASGQQHWGCDPINNPLAKDNLLNAYAALVQVPANAADNAGHTVLYLGSERESNNGTSFAGFWLLKDNDVGCTGTNSFSGQHTDGDILVVSDYTNGGGQQDVSVYRWTGNDASGSLVLQSSGGVCGASAPDNACAIANGITITTPWTPTSHLANTFVEAGLDLTTLLGSAGGCFTTFMAETRSSAELTATLKDFAGGQFNTCAQPPIDTTATPGGLLNAPGSAQHDVATISAVGNRPAPTGTISFFLCQPADVTAGGCEGTAGTQVGSDVTITNGSATSATVSGATTTSLGKYCWRAEYTPDDAADGFYLPSSHTNATTECFTVVHGTPTLATQIAVTGANAPGLGFTTLGDTATLTGFLGSVTSETITFNLYGPFADGVTPVCTGNPVFTTTGALSAGGVATTSQTYVPTAVGTYVWQASYPGDALNDPATHACNQASEKTTIVGAVIDVQKSANPVGPVSAGQTIGFDITVSNAGAVPATGVTVTDNLPAKANAAQTGDLNWSLVPSYTGCSITGAVGSQVLNCNLGTVAGNSSLTAIHVQSSTTPLDCGVVSNKATVATTNGTGGDSDLANVTVLCPALDLTKTADAASVSAGSTIGFTVTASNSGAAGTGSAFGVTISDPLPSGSGVDWSIASQTAAACSITGAVGSEVLNCNIGTLAAGASYSVHVTSGTVFASCKAYPNTATLNATNAPTLTASDTTTVLCPDLSLTKTADADAVNAGTQIGFVVTASNSNAPGTGTATGVTINDPLPSGSGVDWSILSQTGNACTITGQVGSEVLSCTIPSLAPGATYTVHVVSGTSFVSCGTYPNTATLSSANGGGNLTASDTANVLCADLGIVKSADDPDPVDVGSDIGFTVTVTNNGDGAANGVDVEDPLPGGPGIDWSIDSSTGPLTCSITGTAPTQTLTCTGNLAASGDADGNDVQTVHITSSTQWTGTGADEVNSCGVYDNTATVTWSNGPADAISSNQATETVQCPDLKIVKTADADSVSAGDTIGFSIDVTNDGPGTASDVTINDPLPSGDDVNWTIDSVTGADESDCVITGAVGAQVLECTLGDVTTEDHIVVHVISLTTQNSCADYHNTATLSASNEPDLTASDDTSVLCPDVSLVKDPDAATVNAGEQIGFTITASNSDAEGTGTAKGVIIEDPLPGGDGVDWSIESGPDNCSIVGDPQEQTLLCTGVDLAPGESETVHVVSDTAFESCGVYDNTATLTLTNGEAPDPANATTTVNCPALSITKTADSDSVRGGSQIGFTIVVANAGPGTAKGVTLNDPLPSGQDVSWSIDAVETTATGCSVSTVVETQVLACDLGDFLPGGLVAVHLISSTSDVSCATYPNVATLDAENAPELTADAQTSVTNCLGTAPTPTHSTTPIAVTGAGPVGPELGLVVFLLGSGMMLLVLARPRRRGQHV
jgi:uncharacterized repeat protein (TIGR01451 family)